MSIHALSWGLTVAALLLGTAASAQEPAGADTEATTDSSLEIGGGRWSGSLLSAATYTDNFFYEADNGRSIGGWLLRPVAGYLRETSRARINLGARAEYGGFNLPGSNDDYLDFGLDGDGFLQASTRNRFSIEADVRHGHDPFGLDRTEGAPVGSAADIDEWDEISGRVRHHFGVTGALFNTELALGGTWREYQTNRTSTQYLDYSIPSASATFFYNYSAKTSALLEVSHSEYDFNYAFGATDDRSGSLDRYRLGLKWIATAKTTGDLRAGYRHREFDNSGRAFDGLDWEAGVTWRPLGQTVIKLASGRTEQPSYLSTVRAIDVRHVDVSWNQPWTARFQTDAGVLFSRADFVGAGRRDDFVQGTFEMRYQLLTAVSLIGHAALADRDSSVNARDFDRLNAYAGIQVRL